MEQERQWLWVDWFLFGLRFCWLCSGIIYYGVHPEKLGPFSYPLFIVIVMLCYFIPLAFWRPGCLRRTHYLLAELLTTGCFYVYANIVLHIHRGTAFILMPVLMTGYLATKHNVRWSIPIFIVLLPLSSYAAVPDLTTFFMQYIDIAIFFGFGFAFNYIIASQTKTEALLAQNMRQYELIQEQNRVLEQYAKQIEHMTLLEERNRLARDLHDTIGHHFTSIIVGLDALSYLVDVDTVKTKEKLLSLARVSRSGLEEIRRSIHQIAPDDEDISCIIKLEALAREFASHTGTVVTLEANDAFHEMTQPVQFTFIRCLQEALTNAKRHGEATEITVKLQDDSDKWSMLITNNGHTPLSLQPGFGLKAMQQRLQALQGTLEVTALAGTGFAVHCTIPKRK